MARKHYQTAKTLTIGQRLEPLLDGCSLQVALHAEEWVRDAFIQQLCLDDSTQCDFCFLSARPKISPFQVLEHFLSMSGIHEVTDRSIESCFQHWLQAMEQISRPMIFVIKDTQLLSFACLALFSQLSMQARQQGIPCSILLLGNNLLWEKLSILCIIPQRRICLHVTGWQRLALLGKRVERHLADRLTSIRLVGMRQNERLGLLVKHGLGFSTRNIFRSRSSAVVAHKMVKAMASFAIISAFLLAGWSIMRPKIGPLLMAKRHPVMQLKDRRSLPLEHRHISLHTVVV